MSNKWGFKQPQGPFKPQEFLPSNNTSQAIHKREFHSINSVKISMGSDFMFENIKNDDFVPFLNERSPTGKLFFNQNNQIQRKRNQKSLIQRSQKKLTSRSKKSKPKYKSLTMINFNNARNDINKSSLSKLAYSQRQYGGYEYKKGEKHTYTKDYICQNYDPFCKAFKTKVKAVNQKYDSSAYYTFKNQDQTHVNQVQNFSIKQRTTFNDWKGFQTTKRFTSAFKNQPRSLNYSTLDNVAPGHYDPKFTLVLPNQNIAKMPTTQRRSRNQNRKLLADPHAFKNAKQIQSAFYSTQAKSIKLIPSFKNMVGYNEKGKTRKQIKKSQERTIRRIKQKDKKYDPSEYRKEILFKLMKRQPALEKEHNLPKQLAKRKQMIIEQNLFRPKQKPIGKVKLEGYKVNKTFLDKYKNM